MSDAIKRINTRASATKSVESAIDRALLAQVDDDDRLVVIGTLERTLASARKKVESQKTWNATTTRARARKGTR